MKRIDLNADIGEGFSNDKALMKIITSANICCGAHAGSESLTERTFQLCQDSGVAAGAHPGYPDPEMMGRRLLDDIDPQALSDEISRQLDLLPDAAYVKPHGALYLQSQAREDAADGLARAMKGRGIPLLGFPGTLHEQAADEAGAPFWPEGFVDRRYGADGRLTPRSHPNCLLETPEEMSAQAINLAGQVASLCVHGDTPGCLDAARQVRQALQAQGWEIASCA